MTLIGAIISIHNVHWILYFYLIAWVGRNVSKTRGIRRVHCLSQVPANWKTFTSITRWRQSTILYLSRILLVCVEVQFWVHIIFLTIKHKLNTTCKNTGDGKQTPMTAVCSRGLQLVGMLLKFLMNFNVINIQKTSNAAI